MTNLMSRPNVLEGAAALWILLAPATALLAQAPQKAAPIPRGAPAGMAHIGRAELLAHAMELASDSYEGRLTASRGQQKAAEYIKNHFEALGLEPLGDPMADGGRSYFQSY